MPFDGGGGAISGPVSTSQPTTLVFARRLSGAADRRDFPPREHRLCTCAEFFAPLAHDFAVAPNGGRSRQPSVMRIVRPLTVAALLLWLASIGDHNANLAMAVVRAVARR